MSTTDKVFCWACKKEVPVNELTDCGRHDEDKGGCGCYLDTATTTQKQAVECLSEEEKVFIAGYQLGSMHEALGILSSPMESYKLWKEEKR